MAESIKTALVCYTQAHFDNLIPDDDTSNISEVDEKNNPLGGRYFAELAGKISTSLNGAGVETDIVKIPQRSFGPGDVARATFSWKLLDLKESNGRVIDLVICLDFPAWALSHPRKICWLSELPNFVMRRSAPAMASSHSKNGKNLDPNNAISSLLQAERRGLAEAWKIMAGSRPIAEELARSGLHTEFNPFPPVDAAPDGEEWKAAIKRLLA